MGLLSFKVTAVSDWFGLLAEKDIPQIWLNDFRCSSICNFSENCPRAGNILDWLNTDKNLKNPLVEWFTYHHVSIWYPWTQDHINACSRPQFAYLQPPVEVHNTNGDNIISNSSPLTAHATSILTTACNSEYQPTHNTKYDPAYSDEYEHTYIPEGIQCRLKSIR